jgi:ATP-dependent DNA helicase RecQ
MPANEDDARQLLRTATGNPECEFRDGQWQAIDALVNQRKRALVIQSTSWGKSMVYFIATWLLRNSGAGPTVVISPLLALMRDQVASAKKVGLRAVTLNSSNEDEHVEIRANILADKVDLILLSPEKLANDQFVAENITPISDRIGLLVVDEAHVNAGVKLRH